MDEKLSVIKVIGLGDCGGKAVDCMIENDMCGMEFVSINTDFDALTKNKAGTRLQIGNNITKGLGAKGIPDVGRSAAEEDRVRIAEMISGSNMVFIVAGMGRGTGSGAASVVAQIAKEMGVLVIAVVTKPFLHEGKRMQIAQTAINTLAELVDALILVPNDRFSTVGRESYTLPGTNQVTTYGLIRYAVAAISEEINAHGIVAVDFADVYAMMSDKDFEMVGALFHAETDRGGIAT